MAPFDIILVGIIGALTGCAAAFFYVNHFINGIVKNLGDIDIVNDINIIDGYIDFEKDMMYMYRDDTDEFIAQGSTWEELNKNTMARYPSAKINISVEDIKKARSFGK